MTKTLRQGKRALALLLIVMIVSCNTYRARAAAVIPAVVEAGEAIAYVLGILGLVAGSGYVIDNKDSLEAWGNNQITALKDWTKENSDKVNSWGAATSQEIEMQIDQWIQRVRTGTIDTASAVWDSVKAWAASIYEKLHSSSGAGVYLGGMGLVTNYSKTVLSSNNTCWFNVHSEPIYGAVFATGQDSCVVFVSTATFSAKSSYSPSSITIGGVQYYYHVFSSSADTGDYSVCELPLYPYSLVENISTYRGLVEYVLGMSVDIPADEYISVGGVSDIFDRDKTLDNIGVIVPGIAAGATDIPIDWGLVGDVAGTLAGVREGTLDIADALEDAKVFPTDTTRDTVIDSDGDLTNDKSVDDVIPAVPDTGELGDYTLSGLEKVFPFCIPFDFVALLNCLSADPQAPAFDWVIPVPGKNGTQEYKLHVDLSPWEPVAKIVRTMETLAFSVGLVLITRQKMIRG